jgi:hypothetical protein
MMESNPHLMFRFFFQSIHLNMFSLTLWSSKVSKESLFRSSRLLLSHARNTRYEYMLACQYKETIPKSIAQLSARTMSKNSKCVESFR